MAFYCQNMLEIALILTNTTRCTKRFAFKFVEHFLWIPRDGPHREQHDEMWMNRTDSSMICCDCHDGQAMRLKVRSLVGLLPLARQRCSRETPSCVTRS